MAIFTGSGVAIVTPFKENKEVDNQFLGPCKLAVAAIANNYVYKGDHGDEREQNADGQLLDLCQAIHDLFVGFH